MGYLKGATELKLTLKDNGGGVVQWWVDAAYAVHKDARSHGYGFGRVFQRLGPLELLAGGTNEEGYRGTSSFLFGMSCMRFCCVR